MQLSIRERLILPALYPAKDTRMNQVIVQSIKNSAEISPVEWEDAGIQYVDKHGFVGYQVQKNFIREIALSTVELTFLKQRIDQLDNDRMFTIELLSLADKIEEELNSVWQQKPV